MHRLPFDVGSKFGEYTVMSEAEAHCRLDGETRIIPRSAETVGHIVGGELDEMSEFRQQAWAANSDGMVGHFQCDGVWYTLECYPTPKEQLEEFGLG